MRFLGIVASIGALSAAGVAGAATLDGVGEFTGNAGIGTSNGDVTDSPVGSNYVYVSTDDGVSQDGLNQGGETNGSELVTNSFTASAGETLSYYFNYVTSDGAGFADYAYAQLLGAGDPLLIFTARTTTTGDTVPGFGLPDLSGDVTLTPSSSAIVAGGPDWNELGGSSGGCFSAGCGYTGWINATYTIPSDGLYQFLFGVVNWNDQQFDSGLAIAGLTVGDQVIIPGDDTGGEDPPGPSPIPLPASVWLLGLGLAGMGAMGRRRRKR